MTELSFVVGGHRKEADWLACLEEPPSLLCSYAYLSTFLKNRELFRCRNWRLDSGAYTASNTGRVIDIMEYEACCFELLESDPQLIEVFGLDVIGDWRASIRNAEQHWSRGLEAIPTIHIGEPEEAIQAVRDFPKIAVG